MVYPYNGILVSKIGINNMDVVLKSWHAAVHGFAKSWTHLSDLSELNIYIYIYMFICVYIYVEETQEV